MTALRVERFPSREELFASAEGLVATALSAALEAQPRVSLALSGGSTPEPLYRRLAANAALPWSRVAVTLVDERWVPLSDPDSNEAMIARTLGAVSPVTGLYTGHDSPEAGMVTLKNRLASLPQPFAATVLGMGDDGHTASWFPGGDTLSEAMAESTQEPVMAMRANHLRSPRLTWTLPPILASRLVIVLLTGAAKLAVLERAMQPGPVAELPIRAVLRQTRAPVRVLWAG